MAVMKLVSAIFAACVLLSIAAFGQAHVPAPGSAERKAVIDGLKAEYMEKGNADGNPYNGTITFNVKYIKVNKTWAWVYAEPRSTSQLDQFGENSGYLLARESDGKWRVQPLPDPIDDPDDPENLDYPTAKDVAAMKKIYTYLPVDIFPRQK